MQYGYSPTFGTLIQTGEVYYIAIKEGLVILLDSLVSNFKRKRSKNEWKDRKKEIQKNVE